MVKIDIEMPTYCYDCPCHDGAYGYCNITGDSTFDKRPFDCPLKEDVVPAKQAAWRFNENNHMFYCTNCNGEMVRSVYSYCPWCGAKMDGKVDK